MFFRVLKKDLFKKTALNIIMLIFIIMSTMFLAGSVNSLMTATDSLEKFMEVSNVPDLTFILTDYPGNREKAEKLARENEELFSEPYFSASYMTTDDRFTYGDGKVLESTQTLAICEDQPKYGYLFDENNQRLNLKKGEISLPLICKDKNDIKIGDKIYLDIGSKKMEFTLAAFTKDAMFGSEFISVKRIACSSEDFKTLSQKLDPTQFVSSTVFFANTNNVKEAQNLFRTQKIQTILDADKSVFKWTYVMNSIISIVFVVASLCLLLIAVCILRFTIIFTLEGDYKEIGVLKAIGVRNQFVRTLYISKYFVLSAVGASLGLIASFPFEKMLTKEMNKSFVSIESGKIAVNILCAFCIVLCICLFCFWCTRRLNKFSAIDAIRSGESGERFSKKGFIRLEKRKKLRPFAFLALNDVLSNPKQFFVMIMTFVFGVLMLIIPINAVSTLRDDSIVNMFGISQSDYFMMDQKFVVEILSNSGTRETIRKYLRESEDKLAKEGINANVTAEMGFSTVISSLDGDDYTEVLMLQGIDTDADSYVYTDGTAPKLANEIALSEVTAETLGVKIGDTVKAAVGEETGEYIVTAKFQTMNNLGKGARINDVKALDYAQCSGAYSFQIFLDEPADEDVSGKIKKALGNDVDVMTCAQYVENNIGSIESQLESISQFLLILMVCVNSLVVFLMVKSFIMREKNQIAMLKSIGFRNSTIKAWYIARIGTVLIISIILAFLLSILLNLYVIPIPFKMMGASNIKIIVDWLNAYLIYPAIIFICTIIAAALSVIGIGRISAREINNME